jgi:hypothetical protein
VAQSSNDETSASYDSGRSGTAALSHTQVVGRGSPAGRRYSQSQLHFLKTVFSSLPPPFLPDPVLPLGDKGGLCALVLLKISVWPSVTVLSRCGHGVGLLSVGCKLYLCGMVWLAVLALARGVVTARCPCTTLELLAPLVFQCLVACCTQTCVRE